jgi:cobalt-zinc-cadmium efflux system outer membrane protein
MACMSFIPSRLFGRSVWLAPLSLCILALSPCMTLAQMQGGVQAATSAPALDDSRALRLADLTRAMLQHNPQLKSASLGANAAQMAVSPAGAPDNPTLSMTQDQVRNNPLAWNNSGSANWTYSQNIYWPGKKSLNAQVVAAQASGLQAQAEALQSQLLGQLRATWLAWQSAQAQLQLFQSQLAKLDQIKEITKIRYAQNAAAFADYINAQVTQQQMRSTVLATRLQADTLLGQMATLIGQTSIGPLTVQIEDLAGISDVPGLDDWLARAYDRHPLLRASAAAVQAAQRALELAELGRRPDFNIAVSGYAAQPPWGLANNHNYAMSLGMTFPLWYEQKEKWLINQAQLQLQSSQQADESQRQQIRLGVQTAWLQCKQTLDQLQLYETSILQQARLAYRLALKNYSSGQAAYIDLLNAFNAERGAELNAIQARANAWTARAALKAAAGDTDPDAMP